jgi:hypothetical protein
VAVEKFALAAVQMEPVAGAKLDAAHDGQTHVEILRDAGQSFAGRRSKNQPLFSHCEGGLERTAADRFCPLSTRGS